MPKRPLVAIVDDDESIRNTTKDLLESAGFAAAVFARAAILLKSKRLSEVCCLIAFGSHPKISANGALLRLPRPGGADELANFLDGVSSI